jgi:transposase
MIARYGDRQLRHRIYQSALKGELNAIIDKAREYGVPVLMVDPRNTSKICPIHNASIEYGEDRIGICSKGGERWHREVVALINALSYGPRPSMRAMPRRDTMILDYILGCVG